LVARLCASAARALVLISSRGSCSGRASHDRVKIIMSGKFPPYKYYENTGNVPEYGYNEK
jgi:hypothetical protein